MRYRVLSLATLAMALISLVAMTGPALSETSKASIAGVSALSYAPKPFYDDLSRMRVRFTTTGRARPGWRYVVSLAIAGPDTSSGDCTPAVISLIPSMVVNPQRILGAPGKTYTVLLRADYNPLHDYFCQGRARLEVYTVAIRDAKPGSARNLRTVNFRILHAP